MIDFTPQYATERGYNPKELRFYLNDELVDNRIIVAIHVSEEMNTNSDGWIDHIFYVPDTNYQPQFNKNGICLAVPKNITEGVMNQFGIDAGVVSDKAFEPRIVRAFGQVRWNIEKRDLSDVKEE